MAVDESAIDFFFKVCYTARHDTLQTLHLDDISSAYKDRDRCLYTHSIQNINYELVPGTAHYHIPIISQHYNFMLIGFCILEF
jgi:hypothetical protein